MRLLGFFFFFLLWEQNIIISVLSLRLSCMLKYGEMYGIKSKKLRWNEFTKNSSSSVIGVRY